MPSNLETSVLSDFLATLAQISAGLLAVLVAGMTAYVVFLQERASQFAERIEQDRIEIRVVLQQLRSRWPTRGSLFVPVEFREHFRSEHAGKSGAELIQEAVLDLMLRDGATLRKTFARTADKSDDRPIKGRIYLWILNEVTDLLTRGGPPGRPQPKDVFPHAIEPGFPQWKDDLDRIRPLLTYLSMARGDAKKDLEQFAARLESPAHQRQAFEVHTSTVDLLFSTLDAVNEHLDNIVKQQILARNYDFRRRVHLPALIALIVLGFGCGVVAPLALLAGGWPQTRIVTIGLLVVSLVWLFAAFLQFVRDVSASPDVHAEYLASRWYQPALEDIKRNRLKLAYSGLVDYSLVGEMNTSSDRATLPPQLTLAASEYSLAAERYNLKASALNNAIVDAIRADDYLSGLIAPERFRSGPQTVAWTGEILDSTTLESKLSRVANDPNHNFGVETAMPNWSKVELLIPGDALHRDARAVLTRLVRIGSGVAKNAMMRELSESKSALQVKADRLQSILEKLVKTR